MNNTRGHTLHVNSAMTKFKITCVFIENRGYRNNKKLALSAVGKHLYLKLQEVKYVSYIFGH